MSVMQNLLAADTTVELQPKTGNFVKLGTLTLPDIVSGLIRGALVVAAIVFFFILVIGGIKWIASGGDKAATEGARNQITAALIGLVIVFAAWAIVALINTFFGINIFSLTLPSAV
jgi:pseudouridine-5'-phosphate glycosidase